MSSPISNKGGPVPPTSGWGIGYILLICVFLALSCYSENILAGPRLRKTSALCVFVVTGEIGITNWGKNVKWTILKLDTDFPEHLALQFASLYEVGSQIAGHEISWKNPFRHSRAITLSVGGTGHPSQMIVFLDTNPGNPLIEVGRQLGMEFFPGSSQSISFLKTNSMEVMSKFLSYAWL